MALNTTTPLRPGVCPACGSLHRDDAGFLVDETIPLFHCRDCGLGALALEDGTEEGYDEYWSDVNQQIYADPAVISELTAKYEGYFKKVESEVPNKRFLDVGSGAGMSIGTAARMGFDATGVEPSEHAVALSRRLFDVPVIRGLLGADDALPRDYGMLALWDVIEHVGDPEALLRTCHMHLAPKGLLLLETPDEGTLLRRMVRTIGKLGIPGLDQRNNIYYRAHRFYFTRRAMTSLLERCGFGSVRYYGEHTMFGKELRKKKLYGGLSPMKEACLRMVFMALKHLPVMANKMVVVAVKTSA